MSRNALQRSRRYHWKAILDRQVESYERVIEERRETGYTCAA